MSSAGRHPHEWVPAGALDWPATKCGAALIGAVRIRSMPEAVNALRVLSAPGGRMRAWTSGSMRVMVLGVRLNGSRQSPGVLRPRSPERTSRCLRDSTEYGSPRIGSTQSPTDLPAAVAGPSGATLPCCDPEVAAPTNWPHAASRRFRLGANRPTRPTELPF